MISCPIERDVEIENMLGISNQSGREALSISKFRGDVIVYFIEGAKWQHIYVVNYVPQLSDGKTINGPCK